jgi:Pentapeptide repeats (8 copies)
MQHNKEIKDIRDKLLNWLPSSEDKGNGTVLGVIAAVIGLATVIITQIGQRTPPWIETQAHFKEAREQIKSDKHNGIKYMEELVQRDPRIQWQVVEELSRLIRTESPAPSKLNIQAKNKKEAPEYVATAVKVLKNRNPDNDKKGKQQDRSQTIINLKKVNLLNTDLEQAQLPQADLSHSDLTNVVLTNANLKGAFLRGTYLRGASLKGVNLIGAQLQKADLFTAVLKDADLSGADLTGANFTPEQIRQARNWDRAIDKTGKLDKIKGE